MAFLERDIKARKQTFGIEIYDILQSNSGDDTSAEIQKAFEACQMDIQHLEAKVNSKRDEMVAINTSSGTGATGGQSSSGAGHMDDAETPGIPSTPCKEQNLEEILM